MNHKGVENHNSFSYKQTQLSLDYTAVINARRKQQLSVFIQVYHFITCHFSFSVVKIHEFSENIIYIDIISYTYHPNIAFTRVTITIKMYFFPSPLLKMS